MSGSRRFELSVPTRIVVGLGALSELGGRARGRVLLVTTQGATERGLTGRALSILGADRVVVHDRVASNPTVAAVDAAIEQLRQVPVDTIVAVGGGSTIDTAKILGLALAAPGAGVLDLVDGAGGGAHVGAVPVVAVPTTAGTGSEVTPFATVWDPAVPRKLSVAGPRLFPELALVDATLAVGLPWEQTLATGLDAYVQCLEAIYNRNANPVTTALAERGALLAPGALRRLRREPGSLDARSDMAAAALLSGLAISHTRTALAHSISYPITASFGVPHGLACALVAPAVLEFNLEADDGRLAEAARRLGFADGNELLGSVVELVRELGVWDEAGRYLPGIDALHSVASEMLTPSRSDNNLRAAGEGDVRAILDRTGDLVAAVRRR